MNSNLKSEASGVVLVLAIQAFDFGEVQERLDEVLLALDVQLDVVERLYAPDNISAKSVMSPESSTIALIT